MTDEEWFQTKWTERQLFDQYNEETMDEMRREHAFTGYWKRRANSNIGEMLSGSDVNEIQKYHRWWGAVGDVVDYLVTNGKLSKEAGRQILPILPENSHGWNTLKTFLTLGMESLNDQLQDLNWVDSAGGPMIVLQENLLDYWEGANPPREGKVVEAQFRFFSDDDPATDYDRACDVENYIQTIPVHSGYGLVLGKEPMICTVLPEEFGDASTVQILCSRTSPDLLVIKEALRRKEELVVDNRCTYMCSAMEHIVFDAACGKDDIDSFLRFEIPTGTYTIVTRLYTPDRFSSVVIHEFIPDDKLTG